MLETLHVFVSYHIKISISPRQFNFVIFQGLFALLWHQKVLYSSYISNETNLYSKLHGCLLLYTLAYYYSNLLKLFPEGAAVLFRLKYFIKTCLQANHPTFKLELKGIFLKRGQNVRAFVFIVWNPNHLIRVISKYVMPLQVLLCRHSGYCMHEFETYHTITIANTGQLTI